MNPFLATAGLALAVATSLAAQQGAPATVIPAGPLVTLHVDGPAALRAAFLPTNLGKLFAGPEFKDMLAPMMQMLEGLKQQAGGKAPFDIEAAEKAIYAYGGRLTAALHLLDENIPLFTVGDSEPPKFALTLALSPDGKTDLAAMCAKLVEVAAEKEQGKLAELEVAGKTLTLSPEDEVRVCLPFMHKDHAMVLISSDMKAAAERVLGDDAKTHASEEAFAKGNIGVHINVQKIVAIVDAAAKREGENHQLWSGVLSPIFEGSGIKSLTSLEMTYRPQGPAVLSEAILAFNQNDRGLLGAFFPPQSGRTPLIDLLPRSAMSASATNFDMKHLLTGIQKIFTQIGDNAPMTYAQLEEGFKEHYGLRLQEDFIDLFGNGLIFAQMEQVEGGQLGSAEGMCFGLAVSDGAKLTNTIDTMLRKNGLHAGREKADYKGFTVYEMAVGGMIELSYAVSGRMLLIGIGGSGGDPVRAILDEEKNLAEGKPPVDFPADIANRLKMVPGGWVGLGWSDLRGQFQGALDQLDLVAAQMPPQMGMVMEVLEKLPPLLKNYKVEHQVSISRSTGSRWVYQNVW